MDGVSVSSAALAAEPAIQVPLDRRAVLLRGVGVILVGSVLFGVMAVCVRIAARDMVASQITFVRFAGAFVVLLATSRGRGLRPQPGNLGRVLLRGLCGASAILLYFRGIHDAGAGFATLLNSTYPIFTTLFATTLLGETFTRRLTVALGLDVIGIAFVLGPAAALGEHALLGGVSSLAGAVLAGAAVSMARQLRGSESAMLVTTYFMAVGAVATAPSLLFGLPSFGPSLVLALAAMVVTSAVAQYLLHLGLGYATATQGSLAAATSVVTAALLGSLFLGETLTPLMLIGGMLLVAAVTLAVSERRDATSGSVPGPRTPQPPG